MGRLFSSVGNLRGLLAISDEQAGTAEKGSSGDGRVGKISTALHEATKYLSFALSARIVPMATIDEAIAILDQLRKELDGLVTSRDQSLDLGIERLARLTNRVEKQLNDWGLSRDSLRFRNVTFERRWSDPNGNFYNEVKAKDRVLRVLREDMAIHPESYVSKPPPVQTASSGPEKPVSKKSERVFLGHGGNKLWARVHMHLKEDLLLDVEAWESTPRAGHHSVEVLKALLSSCTFAVIVATGEDATSQGNLRARQNVVHEVGLFQGRVGFEKVALLRQEGIEEFSNLAGLQVISFPGDKIEASFYELDRMLKRESLIK